MIGTGGGNSAVSTSSVVLGGSGNTAGDVGDDTVAFSTVLSGGGNIASGRELLLVSIATCCDVVMCFRIVVDWHWLDKRSILGSECCVGRREQRRWQQW
jgi:hypothetical protein